MCTDVDYLPQLMVLTEQNLFLRKSSWTPSISSSSSTSTTMKSSGTSWLERKLFSHFKRFFRRQSFSSPSTSADSSRRTSIAVTDEKVFNDDFPIEKAEEEEEEEEPIPLPAVHDDHRPDEEQEEKRESTATVDPLYDYDQLLQRCWKKQEHHRLELLEHCQKPVTIPHADLSISHSRTLLINWKSYTRLFRALNRDPQLFQQYLSQSYSCSTTINQREQLVLNVRTSQSRVDLLLRTFLNEFVTCFECQKAQSNLIRTTNLWRIECQLCGSQRTVSRLRWKHSARTQ